MKLRPDARPDSSISKVCLTEYGRVVMYSTHKCKDEVSMQLL